MRRWPINEMLHRRLRALQLLDVTVVPVAGRLPGE